MTSIKQNLAGQPIPEPLPQGVMPPAIDLGERLPLLVQSFLRLTGQRLTAADTTEALWAAPRVIVAHGRGDDPLFFYGNRLALEVFETDAAHFVGMPSRYSAEPVNRAERDRLLARVSRDGFIADYAGVRISARGRRFRIEQAVVWNLIDAAGTLHGQAATFERWVLL